MGLLDGVDEALDNLLQELADDAAAHLEACSYQENVRRQLEKEKETEKETEAQQKLAAITLQRVSRGFFARRVLRRLKENKAALHIQRLTRARLARNEVNALKLQRDALDAEAAGVPHPRTVMIKQKNTAGHTLTFLKAADVAGVQELTRISDIDLNHAVVELNRKGLTMVDRGKESNNRLRGGAMERLQRSRGTTSKLISLENELTGRVGELAQAHLNRPPTYAFDSTGGGVLRVDVSANGYCGIRSASKIKPRTFVER